jgi:hypothetical protein
MARLALPLSLIAAAALAACVGVPETVTDNPPASRTVSGPVTGQPILYTANTPVQGGTPLVPAGTAFKPGNGTIESISIVHIVPLGSPAAAPSASQGASTIGTAGDRLAYRLTIKMDDGSFQAVDQDNRNFAVGDRVALGADGRVIKQ